MLTLTEAIVDILVAVLATPTILTFALVISPRICAGDGIFTRFRFFAFVRIYGKENRREKKKKVILVV